MLRILRISPTLDLPSPLIEGEVEVEVEVEVQDQDVEEVETTFPRMKGIVIIARRVDIMKTSAGRNTGSQIGQNKLPPPHLLPISKMVNVLDLPLLLQQLSHLLMKTLNTF